MRRTTGAEAECDEEGPEDEEGASRGGHGEVWGDGVQGSSKGDVEPSEMRRE